jgi:hypothetical protein
MISLSPNHLRDVKAALATAVFLVGALYAAAPARAFEVTELVVLLRRPRVAGRRAPATARTLRAVRIFGYFLAASGLIAILSLL